MNLNTDNLQNPLKITDLINAADTKLTWQPITQDMYNGLEKHDPLTVYIIDQNDGTNKLYLGDTEVSRDSVIDDKSHYVMSINKEGKYVISYLKFYYDLKQLPPYFGYDYIDFVTSWMVAEFTEAKDALDALSTYTRFGFHDKVCFKVYDIIYNYIHGILDLHEAIMGILVAFNYQGDPEFSQLNRIIKEAPMVNIGIDEVTMQRLRLSNSIVHVKYSCVYDEFLKNDFFTDDEYKNAEYSDLNISKVIKEIHQRLYTTWPVNPLPPNRVDDFYK